MRRTKQLNINLSKSEHDRLRAMARAQDLTMSQLIRRLLAEQWAKRREGT